MPYTIVRKLQNQLQFQLEYMPLQSSNGSEDWWAQTALGTFWLATLDWTTCFRRGCSMFTDKQLAFTENMDYMHFDVKHRVGKVLFAKM